MKESVERRAVLAASLACADHAGLRATDESLQALVNRPLFN